jgi:hypothetical protein
LYYCDHSSYYSSVISFSQISNVLRPSLA